MLTFPQIFYQTYMQAVLKYTHTHTHTQPERNDYSWGLNIFQNISVKGLPWAESMEVNDYLDGISAF